MPASWSLVLLRREGIEANMREFSGLRTETFHPDAIGKDIVLLVHSSLESHPRLK